MPNICTATPNAVIHGSSAIRPQTQKGTPAALIAVSTNGATRCRSGIGVSFRADQYSSPSTDRDAQLVIDLGGGNTRGLIMVHTTTAATGSSDHQPIQARVHIAAVSSSGTGMRV